VNEVGQVAGSSYLANGATQHAFLYSGGTLLDLGTFGGQSSEALGINIHGHIVGRAQTSRGTTRAFLWRDGSKIDINTLLPPGSGWVLHAATSISDGGQIVGSGTLNGVPQAFLLSPQTDIELRVHGTFTNGSSNLPMGIQAGRTARFIYSALTYSDAGVSVHGATTTHTITGPAVFVDYRPYRESDVCELTPKVLTCKLTMLDAAGYGSEIWMNVRATAPGDITMTSVLTSPVPDPVPANNRTTEENWAVALSDLSLTPATISGGKATSARVTLTDVAPFSDAVVQLASSRPDIAPVPDRVVVQSGGTTRAFNIVPVAVTTPTPVQISATYGQVTVTRTLTVVPTALTRLYLTPTTVIGGCGTSAGKVVLSGNAPAGGAVVQLTNTNGAAHAPATVTVPAGTSASTFTMTTDRVTANTVGNVTASYGGVSQALRLTVRPLRVQTLTLGPNPVRGGMQVTGTIVLECAAPAGGVLVSLSSSNPVVAGPTGARVAIPAGATSGTFAIKTSDVAASTNVSIHATVYGVRKTSVLTLNP
jgi:probable HAF family extracellular repeat protein